MINNSLSPNRADTSAWSLPQGALYKGRPAEVSVATSPWGDSEG